MFFNRQIFYTAGDERQLRPNITDGDFLIFMKIVNSVGKISLIAVFALLLILITWGSSWFLIDKNIEEDQRGPFGDKFGAVNSLFSGFAFAGIIIAIYLQKKELEYQRQELEETRIEIRGQRTALEAQNTTLASQKFENTFFHLLQMHHEIVKSITLTTTSYDSKVMSDVVLIQAQGRESFRELYKKLSNEFNNIKNSFPLLNADPSELEIINSAYLNFFEYSQSKVGHYFRNLYNIMKFIHRSNIDDKKFYANLVRAQLSAYELLLLFYNCLSDCGKEKFKPITEDYALLENIPEDLLDTKHKTYYSPQAFGE